MEEGANFYDFSNSISPEQFKIDIGAILSNVNYLDKPIIFLICYHIIIFILAIIFRYHRLYRTILFVYCMIFALLTEMIGKILQKNWKSLGFSSNYFDEDNVFLLMFFALPPIITCIFLLSNLIGSIFDRHFAYREKTKMKKEKTETKKDGTEEKKEKTEVKKEKEM